MNQTARNSDYLIADCGHRQRWVARVTRAEPARNRNDPKIAALERRHSNEMGNTQTFFRRSGADFN